MNRSFPPEKEQVQVRSRGDGRGNLQTLMHAHFKKKIIEIDLDT